MDERSGDLYSGTSLLFTRIVFATKPRWRTTLHYTTGTCVEDNNTWPKRGEAASVQPDSCYMVEHELLGKRCGQVRLCHHVKWFALLLRPTTLPGLRVSR